MERSLAIEELRKLTLEGRTPEVEADTPAHTRWRANAESVLRKALPSDSAVLARFVTVQYYRRYAANTAQAALDFQNATREAVALLEAAIFELGLSESEKSKANAAGPTPEDGRSPDVVNSEVVFVVHGRNIAAKDALFEFLASIGLSPVEWDEAIKWTGSGTPYVGDIIDAGLNRAQAVIVLMTPDEVTYLDKAYASGENDQDTLPAAQVRPNVLFEAGMAMGRKPKQTILVQLGELRSFSDVHGRHVIRLSNDIEMRRSLALRLQTVGCNVNMSTDSWKEAGNFEIPKATPSEFPIGRRFTPRQEAPKINLDAKYHSRSGSSGDRLEIINRGNIDIFELDVKIPDFPGLIVMRNELPLKKLPAGKSFNLIAVRTMAPSLRQFEVTITGRTGDGESISVDAFVDTLG